MSLRIALTMRLTRAEGYDEPRDAISHDWVRTLEAWSMVPLLVPNTVSRPEEYLDALSCDALVLTGGDDPGETPARDETEARLLAHARGRALPVLGVCRGMQIINRAFGGALSPVDGHVAVSHGVTVMPEWQAFYGEAAAVNSFHGLGIEAAALGEGLVATAFDFDGRIEALCLPGEPLAAVMWHPERAGAPGGDRALVEHLANGGFAR